MSKKLLFLTSFVLVLTLAASTSAQIDPNNWMTCWWSNASADGNLWSDANNWYCAEMYWDEVNEVQKILEREPNQVPGPNEVVCIGRGAEWIPYPNDMENFGPIGSCLIDSSVTAECYQLLIGADSNDPNMPRHLEMTGGTLTIKVDSDDWIGLNVSGYFENCVGSMTVRGNSVVDINYIDPADPYGGLLDIGGGIDIGDYNSLGTFTMLDNCIVKCYHFDCPDAFNPEDRYEAHTNLWGGTLYCNADNVDWTIFWLGDTGSAQTSTFDIRDGKMIASSSGIEYFGDEQVLNAINGWIDEGKITAFELLRLNRTRPGSRGRVLEAEWTLDLHLLGHQEIMLLHTSCILAPIELLWKREQLQIPPEMSTTIIPESLNSRPLASGG